MRIHLDTDLGSDMDDLAALVMLLGVKDVELTGVTTSIDPGGRRAGYVQHVLDRAGRNGVAVAAGAEVSLTKLVMPGDIPAEERRWPEPPPPAPSPAGAASALLAESVEAGATIVAIGPFTNLALLGVERPDVLERADVVLMGGWFDLPREGLPPSGPEQDWNVQCDTTAAAAVVGLAGVVTMVSLPLTYRVHLQKAHLEGLRASGPLGTLIAFQAEHQGAEESTMEIGAAHAGLPDDLLNFQHDPLACAAALGWSCVSLEPRRIDPVLDGPLLRFVDDPGGRRVSLATAVRPDAFHDQWMAAVEAADRNAPRP